MFPVEVEQLAVANLPFHVALPGKEAPGDVLIAHVPDPGQHFLVGVGQYGQGQQDAGERGGGIRAVKDLQEGRGRIARGSLQQVKPGVDRRTDGDMAQHVIERFAVEGGVLPPGPEHVLALLVHLVHDLPAVQPDRVHQRVLDALVFAVAVEEPREVGLGLCQVLFAQFLRKEQGEVLLPVHARPALDDWLERRLRPKQRVEQVAQVSHMCVHAHGNRLFLCVFFIISAFSTKVKRKERDPRCLTLFRGNRKDISLTAK